VARARERKPAPGLAVDVEQTQAAVCPPSNERNGWAVAAGR
jgi:hypothetical protein